MVCVYWEYVLISLFQELHPHVFPHQQLGNEILLGALIKFGMLKREKLPNQSPGF